VGREEEEEKKKRKPIFVERSEWQALIFSSAFLALVKASLAFFSDSSTFPSAIQFSTSFETSIFLMEKTGIFKETERREVEGEEEYKQNLHSHRGFCQ